MKNFDPNDPIYSDFEKNQVGNKEQEIKQEDMPTLQTLDERVKQRIQEQGGKRNFMISEVREREQRNKVRDFSKIAYSVVLVAVLIFFLKTLIFDNPYLIAWWRS